MSQVLPSVSPATQGVQAGTHSASTIARVKAGIDPWTVDDAADVYNLRGWGKGFFEVGKNGNVLVRPTRTPGHEVDLFEIVKGLRERGLRTPVLLHFSDLLHRRLQDLHEAFDTAIRENGYKGKYNAVYPIKVNQQRRVVQEIREYGEQYGFGLEVGSKPELLAVMGLTSDSADRLIICNGFKEDRYIEFVTLAAKLGRNIIPVIENLTELRLIVKYADKYQIRPKIGVRVNLATPGAGRWRHSSGVKVYSKRTLPHQLMASCRRWSSWAKALSDLGGAASSTMTTCASHTTCSWCLHAQLVLGVYIQMCEM